MPGISEVVALFGGLLAALGIAGLATPAALTQLVNSVWRSKQGIYLAIGFRALFGIVLIAAAPKCHFPVVVRVLGVISLASAVVAMLLGFERLRRLVDWWVSRPTGFIRGWSLVAVAFGLFLVYAAAWPD